MVNTALRPAPAGETRALIQGLSDASLQWSIAMRDILRPGEAAIGSPQKAVRQLKQLRSREKHAVNLDKLSELWAEALRGVSGIKDANDAVSRQVLQHFKDLSARATPCSEKTTVDLACARSGIQAELDFNVSPVIRQDVALDLPEKPVRIPTAPSSSCSRRTTRPSLPQTRNLRCVGPISSDDATPPPTQTRTTEPTQRVPLIIMPASQVAESNVHIPPAPSATESCKPDVVHRVVDPVTVAYPPPSPAESCSSATTQSFYAFSEVGSEPRVSILAEGHNGYRVHLGKSVIPFQNATASDCTMEIEGSVFTPPISLELKADGRGSRAVPSPSVSASSSLCILDAGSSKSTLAKGAGKSLQGWSACGDHTIGRRRHGAARSTA